MKESEGIRSCHYGLADGPGMIEVNPYQVRYIQAGRDDTTIIHFAPDHSVTVTMPFERVSVDLRHVFGARVKQWGPEA